ncbi:SOS response-associated peptidase [Limibaculum sp. M0105]|uniref:Abasic site processing protein n=1 Tax=Thermohalobaculum xanthum TaxID=2753746 RepID=A0A8J7M9H5_9RHOB|nr:SOS response-associated peptidase [Thermohalobaculum xanthum]MBK0400628.1 SOS response-associated peptidase [Thermohalobaculum xanthum]
MCGRFATGLIAEQPETAGWLGLDAGAPGTWPGPRWNIAPTDMIPIVRADAGGRCRVAPARWGLIPRWWRKPLSEMRASTFNARAEEAAGKPMFRDAWRHGRCLVPAIGYYEWTGPRGDKTPWFISLSTNAPGFCMAGLWAEPTIDGTPLLTATVLTTAAGGATRELHPRSPVVLMEDEWEAWLRGDADAAALMHPAPDDRVRISGVSREVNRVGIEGPQLIEPAGLGL